MDHLCYLCLVFIAALWPHAGKGRTWLLFVMFNCAFVTFPCGIQGQVWYLVVSIPDLCRLSYLVIHDDCTVLVLFYYTLQFYHF